MRASSRIVRHITLGLVLAFTFTACYHATINTGKRPGNETVTKPWAHSFIAGLVPPSTVDVASQCTDGVARVETQLSFLNMLATAVTFNLYSPMTIEVTCAAAGGMEEGGQARIELPEGSDEDALRNALTDAANRSADTGEAVYVSF